MKGSSRIEYYERKGVVASSGKSPIIVDDAVSKQCARRRSTPALGASHRSVRGGGEVVDVRAE